jgi:hypothetical protein
MKQGQNCEDERKAHWPNGCDCGYATFRPANAPTFINSIMTGEDLSEQIARLRRIRAVADEHDG